MRPEATPAYLTALRQSHTARVWGEILNAGQPDPRFDRVPLRSNGTDGSTVMSREQLVRRRSSIVVGDPAWIPRKPSDPLAGYGLEMRLWYEVSALNLAPVSIPLITGHILSGQRKVPFDGIPVTVVDRMWRPSVDDFVGKRTFQGSVIDSIRGLIVESLPWAEFYVHPTIAANDIDMAPTVYESKADALAKMSASLGADSVHGDAYGTICLIPVPDPAAPPVWEVNEGPGGVLIEATETWSSENAPNSVIVKGVASGGVTPQSALIVDDDPLSPTYYGPVDGPPAPSQSTGVAYPRQRKEWSGPMRTVAQCNIAAQATLLQFKGQAKSIEYGAIANPALEDSDPVLVRIDADGGAEQHLHDGWTIRHDGSGMDASSRAVTLNDAGSTPP